MNEVAFAVINGNYAVEAGLSVADDAIAYEASDSEAAKTYVNIIAVKEGNENNEGIVALVDALKSDEIKDFINETYNGAVIPYEPYEDTEDSTEADTEETTEADTEETTEAASEETTEATETETDAQ